MFSLKKLLFISLLLFSYSAIAEESWYQVEVIVFDRLSPNLDGEQWQDQEFNRRDNMAELQQASLTELIPYSVLDKSRNRLGGIHHYFKLSSDFRPLYHVSWQQEATERRDSRYVHIQRLDGEATTVKPVSETEVLATELEEPAFIEDMVKPNRIIDGSIRIRSGFYLHADIDLSYFTQLPPENKVLRTSEESFMNGFDKTEIKLKETRKIKLNEIHYFDHPMFGVVLQVSRL
jgi:hypothetical protein